jgi:hypothetical protein
MSSNTSDGRIILPSYGQSAPTLTFTNEGGHFKQGANGILPISFESKQLPLGVGAALAENTMPLHATRNMNITFSLANPGTTSFGAGTAEVDGELIGTNVTITTKTQTALLGKPVTNLRIGNGANVTDVLAFGTNKITSTGSITLEAAEGTIHGDKGVTINAANILSIDTTHIDAGQRFGSVTPTAPIDDTRSAPAFYVKGSVSLQSGKDMIISPQSTIEANGGNVSLLSNGGKVALSPNTIIGAYGGNVQIFAATQVQSAPPDLTNTAAPTILAIASGTPLSSVGGGVIIGSGEKSSTHLSTALAQKTGTLADPAPLSSAGSVALTPGSHGTLQINGPGTTELAANGLAASLTLNGGAIVFDATAGHSTNFNQVNIQTAAFKPIAFLSAGASSAAHATFMQAEADTAIDTAYGAIEVKRNALLSIEEDGTVIRIKACSGPDDVTAIIDGHAIPVAPGQELILTANEPSDNQLNPNDGIGRRIVTTQKIGHAFATVCDFSIVSYLQNSAYLEALRKPSTPTDKRILNSLLKTAAVVHTVSGAKKGAYTAKRSS